MLQEKGPFKIIDTVCNNSQRNEISDSQSIWRFKFLALFRYYAKFTCNL